ncbi:metallophosphoesterase [Candidatus Marsarchaeota archaeon]|nr:metallophosphoesterase [Candidatus Marsarchaeota archaeon]MCL5404531.1 metallophosphoesterase [Candidatus Marsarchaeota archaeon]
MMLGEDIELLDGLPIAFIKSLNALAVADIHLGYEGVMAKRGVLIPKVNFNKMTESISKAIAKTNASTLIVDGDIKNEFSKVDEEEFNELYDFIMFAKGKGIKPILIKGNHDNFVERYKEPFKLEVHRQQARMGKYLFFHGEEMPEIGKAERGVKTLIMGHEHPAIGIINAIGNRERLKCFLHGSYKGKSLLVLPALNYLAGGTEVNIVPYEELLSPIFSHVSIDKMHAIAIGYGSTIDFGEIRNLRRIAYE